MKQSKLIAPAFAAAMLLTGCGGRNNNRDRDVNYNEDYPALTESPQYRDDNVRTRSDIERSNESANDDIARKESTRNTERILNNNDRNNVVNDIADDGREVASDIVEGGRRIANDARDAVNDAVDGRDDNDGTYQADENGNVTN